jgi:hypothetical protein
VQPRAEQHHGNLKTIIGDWNGNTIYVVGGSSAALLRGKEICDCSTAA